MATASHVGMSPIVQRNPVDATVAVAGGRFRLSADSAGFTIDVEADSTADAQRLQGLLSHRVETIGRRDRLEVRWSASYE